MDSAIEVGRSTKKVKRRTDDSLDLDDLVVNEKGIRVDRVGTQLVSWKEKLMGSASTGANIYETLDANGCKADSVIAKVGFENSFRVEAMVFAEGIWLLWNDDIIVDILKVHTLFIHMRIWVDRN
ncbi:hypothetical protein Gotri_018838 [Gossypium trilobum]|uniref:Uncharacterized protein n=1 Tax=Gossypium trilobum TaxID=34281 RepID=A0A7J9EAY4_9ROSI|nr:hypothetical protein [Gossypium trilobum]